MSQLSISIISPDSLIVHSDQSSDDPNDWKRKTSCPPGSSSHVSHAPGTFQGPKLASKSPDTSHRLGIVEEKPYLRFLKWQNFPDFFCVLPKKTWERTKSCIIE